MFTAEQFSLKGKKAIVTGGTRGLGNMIALAYRDMGAEVVLWGRSPRGAQVAEEMGGDAGGVYFVQGDVAKSGAVDAMADKSIELLKGRADILVNAAGVQYRAPALDFPKEEWDNILNVNLRAVFLVSCRIGELMCRQGKGRIINLASMCSFFGNSYVSAYSASKGGVMQLTKALSNEWAAKGVNVNAIAPGYMATAMTSDMKERTPKQYAQITERIPKGRWGRPEDIQGLAVFLASDASEYVTGAILPVDGGYLGY